MSRRPSLQEFVEDEMLRAPLALDQVIDAVHAHWQQSPPLPARTDVDPLRLLTRSRRDLVAAAIRELRRLVQSDSAPVQPMHVAGGETTRHMELSLIDEDEVAADIEVARAVDRVKLVAEFEMRELLAFTSALVDDHHVSRDTNPFRPEAYVRALWQGVRAMPISLALQGAFMRDAAEPLARVLRQAYAAACTRLEEQGIQPAAYRTIVMAGTSRIGEEPGGRVAGTLAELRESLHRPAEGVPVAPPAAPPPGATAVDPQAIELLSRLFDAIHDDAELSASTVALLLRLQPTVLRIAVREPAMLEAFDHPVWRLMDRLAFVLGAVAAGEHERGLLHCRRLVDQLASDPATNAARFEWAMSRVAELDRHLLAQAIAAAQPAIGRLHSAIDTASAPLEVGTLDTIPADLLSDDDETAARDAPRAANLRPGDRLRAYLHGDWRLVRLLWCDPVADVWLLQDIEKDKPWALRGSALDRLFAEQLVQRLEPRSLVRAAAERVLRAAGRAIAAPD